jgi:hypothetical protein
MAREFGRPQLAQRRHCPRPPGVVKRP